jgi:hypothetical protein
MRTRALTLLCTAGALVAACTQTATHPAALPPHPSSAASSTAPTGARPAAPAVATRRFETRFESLRAFAGMYVSSQTRSTRQALVASPVHSGTRAHCAWLTGPGTPADTDGPNHRGYPTVQLWRLPGGGFATPAVVDLWVWADVTMAKGDWVSLATLSADASDRWARVVTVNLDPGGWINVFHVPGPGQHEPTLETHRQFPMRKWVHMSITIDFDPRHGSIEVRQNGALVARANVSGGHGRLEQAHFGMYAIPRLTSGKVCNDDLTITTTGTTAGTPGR